jgi:hypothetical protein
LSHTGDARKVGTEKRENPDRMAAHLELIVPRAGAVVHPVAGCLTRVGQVLRKGSEEQNLKEEELPAEGLDANAPPFMGL